MDSQNRPSTMILGTLPDWSKVGESPQPPTATPEPSDAAIADPPKLSPSPLKWNKQARSAIRHINEDPWRTHEAGMQIFLGRDVILARRRDNNAEVVNVEKHSRTSIAVKPILNFMGQISHPSFPDL
jgi:hypothetical protein